MKLITNESEDTRPTLDRVKEAMFSMINQNIAGSVVLDLFAGNGALGIETLSRGAQKVYFNDKIAKCADIVCDNLAHTKLLERASVSTADYREAISLLKKKGVRFDLVLLDPPYGNGFVDDAIKQISDNNMYSDECIIVAEHSMNDIVAESLGNFTKTKTKKYGKICLSVYEIVESET